MKTKTVEIDGQSITFAELTIDDIEAWEADTLATGATAKTMTQALAPSKRAVLAAVATAGITAAGKVGKLPPRALRVLIAEVMAFSSMVVEPGEAQGNA
jgi:hypothetical protein